MYLLSLILHLFMTKYCQVIYRHTNINMKYTHTMTKCTSKPSEEGPMKLALKTDSQTILVTCTLSGFYICINPVNITLMLLRTNSTVILEWRQDIQCH